MKRAFLTILTVLLVSFLPVLAATAEPAEVEGSRPMVRAMMHRAGLRDTDFPRVRMVLRLREKLELTNEQVTKLEAIKAKTEAGNEAVQAKRAALGEAVKSGADESAIRAAATELGSAIGDQVVLRVGAKAEIDGLLTDGQKTKLEEIQQQYLQKRTEKAEAWKSSGGPAGALDPQRAFARIDTDDDGVISLEEFKAHRERMRERRGGEGAVPRGMGRGARRGGPGF